MKVIETIMRVLLGALLIACLLAPAIGQRSDNGLNANTGGNEDSIVTEQPWCAAKKRLRKSC